MKFINFPVDSRSLLLLLFICGTAIHAMEDPPSGESNSDSEMQGTDVEKQSPSFFSISKSTKVKLIKAGLCSLSAVWLAGYATSIWAIATQWEGECEDHYYCTDKYSGMQEEVASSITNCTGPYVQGQPIVEPECQMGSGKAAAFSFTIVCGWIPVFYATVRACRLK